MAELNQVWAMTGGDANGGPTADDWEDFENNGKRRVRKPRGVPAMVNPSIDRLMYGCDVTETAWMAEGHCISSDPDAWFPEHPGHGGDLINDKAARAICEGCPVRDACLEWGIEHDEVGIWGGKGRKARQEIRRERERGAA